MTAPATPLCVDAPADWLVRDVVSIAADASLVAAPYLTPMLYSARHVEDELGERYVFTALNLWMVAVREADHLDKLLAVVHAAAESKRAHDKQLGHEACCPISDCDECSRSTGYGYRPDSRCAACDGRPVAALQAAVVDVLHLVLATVGSVQTALVLGGAG